jgi:hypothetical protein
VHEFTDPDEAIGFADSTANECKCFEAILYDWFYGYYCCGNNEIWYCNYEDAIKEGE